MARVQKQRVAARRGESERDSELCAVRASIDSRPRSTWTADDRNALMALYLYFDSRGHRGDDAVLRNCSSPVVQDVLLAEEMRELESWAASGR